MKKIVAFCFELMLLFSLLAMTASSATLNGSSLSSSPLDSSCQQESLGELRATVNFEKEGEGLFEYARTNSSTQNRWQLSKNFCNTWFDISDTLELECSSGECRGGYTDSRDNSYISERSYVEHKFRIKRAQVTDLSEVQEGGPLWGHQASFGTVRANLRAKLYKYVQDPSLICPQKCNQIFSFREPYGELSAYGYLECTERTDINPFSNITTRLASEYRYTANAQGYCMRTPIEDFDLQPKATPSPVVDNENIAITYPSEENYAEETAPTMACGEGKNIRVKAEYDGGNWLFSKKLCPEWRKLEGDDDAAGRLPIEKQVCQQAQESFKKTIQKICRAKPGESCEPIVTKKRTSSLCSDNLNYVDCDISAEVFCGQVRSGKNPLISQGVPEFSITSILIASLMISSLLFIIRRHARK